MYIINHTGNYLKYWVNYLWDNAHWINGWLCRYIIPFYIALIHVNKVAIAWCISVRVKVAFPFGVLCFMIKNKRSETKQKERKTKKEWICATDSFCDEITLGSSKQLSEGVNDYSPTPAYLVKYKICVWLTEYKPSPELMMNYFCSAYIDDLEQDCSISIANALEILQPCTK